MEFPQKVENKSNNSTSVYLSEEYKTLSLKDMFSGIIYNNQNEGKTQVSLDGWIDKEIVRCEMFTYIFSHIYYI